MHNCVISPRGRGDEETLCTTVSSRLVGEVTRGHDAQL